MQHARKLVLVPQDSIERLRHKNETGILQDTESLQKLNTNTVQTSGTHLTRLDAEMSEILNSSEADERAKWDKYQQVLKRYLFFLGSLKNNANHVAEDDTQESENGIDTDTVNIIRSCNV